jgi:arylsulfatase A
LKGVDKPVRDLSINAGSTGAPAIRKGDWKLILSSGSGSGRGAEKGWLQLYNVAEDIGETKNLAKQFPERVEELKKLYDKIVTDGRSTPGAPQKNDVEVTIWPSTGTK